jgi:hypothetical protein
MAPSYANAGPAQGQVEQVRSHQRNRDESFSEHPLGVRGSPSAGASHQSDTHVDTKHPHHDGAQHDFLLAPSIPTTSLVEQERSTTPSAFMLEWRDHLVAQFHHLNESTRSIKRSFTTLNDSPQDLQEYQANHRQVSSLFPQISSSRPSILSSEAVKGWWEAVTGYSEPIPSPAPPAYEDLYPGPDEASIRPWNIQKTFVAQAAADTAAGLHFEDHSSRPNHLKKRGLKFAKTTNVHGPALARDRVLFFFWVRSKPQSNSFLITTDTYILNCSCAYDSQHGENHRYSRLYSKNLMSSSRIFLLQINSYER